MCNIYFILTRPLAIYYQHKIGQKKLQRRAKESSEKDTRSDIEKSFT